MLIKRSAEDAVSWLNNDILWVGMFKDDKIIGVTEVSGVITSEIAAVNDRISYNMKHIKSIRYDENVECVLTQIEFVDDGKKTVTDNSFLCTKGEDGGFRISAVYKFSICKDNRNHRKTKGVSAESAEKTIMSALVGSDISIWTYYVNEKKTVLSDIGMPVNKLMPKEMYNVPESIIGIGVIDATSISEYRRLFADIDAGAKETEAEIQYICNNGEKQWRFVKYVVSFDESGKPISAVGCSKDISEQKRMEMHYNEELALRAVNFRSALIAFVINITANRVDEAVSNIENAQALKDYCIDDLHDFVCSNIIDEEQRSEFSEKYRREYVLKRYSEGIVSQQQQIWYRFSSGEKRWIEVCLNVNKHPISGDLIATLTARDINDEKIRSLINDKLLVKFCDYVVYIDGESDYATFFTDHTQYVSNENKKMMYSKAVAYFLQLFSEKEDYDSLARKISIINIIRELEDKDEFVVYCRGRRGDRRMHKKIRFSYLNREYKLIVMSQIDITDVFERERAKEEELYEALKTAEHINRKTSEFLSKMSCELRLPMDTIVGMNEVALQSVDDADIVIECLGKIKESSETMLAMLNDILDMSKIESGRIAVRTDKFILSAFFDEMNRKSEQMAKIRHIDYFFNCTDVIDICCVGDAVKLEQVLINFMTNAMKFTAQGGKVTLSVKKKQILSDKICLKCTVSDTGCGISEEFMPKLFEPFEQQNPEESGLYGGTGLGLAICDKLVKMMGGTISVKSIKDVGSEFTVEVTMDVSSDDVQFSTTENIHIPESFSFDGKRVLLAEDHPLNIDIFTRLLSAKGFEVECAENGLAAMEKFTTSSLGYYDAILMDTRMPVMDGLTAASNIRRLSKEDAVSIPIIALTANDMEADAEKYSSAGIDAFISKPVNAGALFDTLYRAIFFRKR